MCCWRIFCKRQLSFEPQSGVHGGAEKGRFSPPHFPSQLLSLLVADMIKAEVHTEVRPKGPAAPFPDVVWGGGCRRNETMWRALACVIRDTGLGGAGPGGQVP